MPEPFYITTPIYYPNAEPHLGHVYTTICSDVIARYYRMSGRETYFLTGTDEHGIKMVKTADAAGVTPAALVEQNVPIFENLWKELKITNDDFIRTTSARHKSGVTKIVEQMVASGDIYLGAYEGWYDEGQEEFVTETEAKKSDFKSAISKRPLLRYSEPGYFFKLTKYAPRVLQHIQANPHFIQPESRRNEVLSKLKAGVDDLSISRATLKWGIPMPNDPAHVLYVWIDALSNYITALGYGSDEATERRSDEGKTERVLGGHASSASSPSSLRRFVASSLFEKYWPANVHLIGKEILWFHTVYWPAMLMSLAIDLPRQIFAHGWWTADGEKMSKSMGNFIGLDRLREVISTLGLDALRYYLVRAAPFGSDLDWKATELNSSYGELGNVVGNCLNRLLNMNAKYRGGVMPTDGQSDLMDDSLQSMTRNLPRALEAAYLRCELQQCALLPVELLRATNGYIDATAPFKLAKDPAQSARLDAVLANALRAVHAALVGLLPILPEKAAQGLEQLGVDTRGRTIAELFEAGLPRGAVFGAAKPLFPRIDPAAAPAASVLKTL